MWKKIETKKKSTIKLDLTCIVKVNNLKKNFLINLQSCKNENNIVF